MPALATAVGKGFDGKFTVKMEFSDRVFYIIITDADIGRIKSPYTLFDKYLDHMLVNLKVVK